MSRVENSGGNQKEPRKISDSFVKVGVALRKLVLGLNNYEIETLVKDASPKKLADLITNGRDMLIRARAAKELIGQSKAQRMRNNKSSSH